MILEWLKALTVRFALGLLWTVSATPLMAASFDILDLYVASSSTGNITLTESLESHAPGATALFTSTPDNDTFSNSLTSGVLRGRITCSEVAICGASGSQGEFVRRAPTGSTVISAVTFLAEPGSPLEVYFGQQEFLVVIGDAPAYHVGGSVSTSANANGTAIAAQLDSYFATVDGVSSATGSEGTSLVHTVTLSRASDGSERLGFLRSNTSTSDADIGTITYSDGVILSGGSLVLPAGLTSFTISVATVDDSGKRSLDGTVSLA
ncbi:hypothetical protein [Sagittula sp. S175]|uniref:hypothetical protein n=1 Tax=Sagittula sp. S175 TaxID=3415129 RepID=UPI003C7C4DF7